MVVDVGVVVVQLPWCAVLIGVAVLVVSVVAVVVDVACCAAVVASVVVVAKRQLELDVAFAPEFEAALAARIRVSQPP